MNNLKILTVFGTRPEAIKLAPVIKELEKYSEEVRSAVAVTAQHREMLDQVLDLFDIRPDYDLDIMRPRQSLFDVTTRTLQGLRSVLEAEKPDILLVQGDTTTTFVAALAAFYLKICVGHVEAGLRTFDKYRPFPEEKNRELTSVLADFHFAPTQKARENLLNAGVSGENIFVTGNTVVDALLATVRRSYEFKEPILKDIDFDSKRVILVTAHRRESWGEPLENICRALQEVVLIGRDIEIIFSVHLNPRVRETVKAVLGEADRVHLIDPLDYQPFVHLMDRCYFILTDSGGIQEEAPSLGKPVLVMREVTERPEGIEAGTVKLVGTGEKAIVKAAEELLYDPGAYKRMAKAVNPYGDGHASERIVEALLSKIKRD